MKTNDIAFLFSRFFALYCLLFFVNYIPSLFYSFFSDSDIKENFISLVISGFSVLYLLLFLFFWIKADWIAEKTISGLPNSDTNTPLTTEGLQNTGFIIVGMFLLVNSIPSLMVFMTKIAVDENFRDVNHIIFNFKPVIEMIIGIFLILGSSGISNAIKKLRG